MFEAQQPRQIFSLSLTIQRLPPEPVELPGPGQEEWRQIFATNVNLRLLFAPDDGLEVQGAQAEFITAQADDRWYLVEWTDLPSPLRRAASAVESTSWGAIKAQYRPTPVPGAAARPVERR